MSLLKRIEEAREILAKVQNLKEINSLKALKVLVSHLSKQEGQTLQILHPRLAPISILKHVFKINFLGNSILQWILQKRKK